LGTFWGRSIKIVNVLIIIVNAIKILIIKSINIDKLLTKKEYIESVIKRVATCSQFLERGEVISSPLIPSSILEVLSYTFAIYADAISLAISACTKD